ncbi:unnamed protein product [Larinioides sclopetarius]|uniref:Uncharacterized protein n=1 Tax=Larinioides sclopetarius TaxID=280406 RepID=A0AAV2A0F7_9ARAC
MPCCQGYRAFLTEESAPPPPHRQSSLHLAKAIGRENVQNKSISCLEVPPFRSVAKCGSPVHPKATLLAATTLRLQLDRGTRTSVTAEPYAGTRAVLHFNRCHSERMCIHGDRPLFIFVFDIRKPNTSDG